MPPIIGDPCPTCSRIDGGHDQTLHDMAANNGKKQYPVPGDSPTGEQD
jgi:hypothetical protein